MYGNTTTFNLDMPTGTLGPELGEELRISSPQGRSIRGYVVESTRKVHPGINPNRFKLRIRHVPLDQLADDAIEIVRYSTITPGQWRSIQ